MTQRAGRNVTDAGSERPILVAYTDDLAGAAVLRAAAQEARLRQRPIALVHQLVGREAPELFGSPGESDVKRHRVEQRILDTAHEIAPTADIEVQAIAHSVISHLVVAGTRTVP